MSSTVTTTALSRACGPLIAHPLGPQHSPRPASADSGTLARGRFVDLLLAGNGVARYPVARGRRGSCRRSADRVTLRRCEAEQLDDLGNQLAGRAVGGHDRVDLPLRRIGWLENGELARQHRLAEEVTLPGVQPGFALLQGHA